MFDIIYTSDNIHLKCFGCEKLVWNRDTVKYFNVSCVRKWAEVPPKSVTVFAKNIVQKDGGGGVLDFWVCCENDTIFFLKCFIGGQKLPFLYISPKYLRCKKILALRQSRNAKFRFRCHFYTELQNATTLSTNGHGLFLVLPVFWRPVTKLQIQYHRVVELQSWSATNNARE